jgi:hypothetical protein
MIVYFFWVVNGGLIVRPMVCNCGGLCCFSYIARSVVVFFFISENNSFINKLKKKKKKRGNFSSKKVTLELANMDDSAHRSSTSNKFKLSHTIKKNKKKKKEKK